MAKFLKFVVAASIAAIVWAELAAKAAERAEMERYKTAVWNEIQEREMIKEYIEFLTSPEQISYREEAERAWEARQG